MFRTGPLPIVRSLITVYIAIGICHASYVDCLLTNSPQTTMTHTYCCVYSGETPDDGQ